MLGENSRINFIHIGVLDLLRKSIKNSIILLKMQTKNNNK